MPSPRGAPSSRQAPQRHRRGRDPARDDRAHRSRRPRRRDDPGGSRPVRRRPRDDLPSLAVARGPDPGGAAQGDRPGPVPAHRRHRGGPPWRCTSGARDPLGPVIHEGPAGTHQRPPQGRQGAGRHLLRPALSQPLTRRGRVPRRSRRSGLAAGDRGRGGDRPRPRLAALRAPGERDPSDPGSSRTGPGRRHRRPPPTGGSTVSAIDALRHEAPALSPGSSAVETVLEERRSGR